MSLTVACADVASGINRIIMGGVDYVLEITGNPQMLQLAIEVIKKRGTAAFFTGDGVPDFVPGGRKAVAVVEGDSVPQIFIPKLIKLYQSGKFPFDRLLKFYDFKDINQGDERFPKRQDHQTGTAHEQ